MGILTSSTKLTVRSKADPDTVFGSIMEGVRPDSIGRFIARSLSYGSEIVGYCDGQIIKLQNKSCVRNSLRPTMEVALAESSHGGTIIRTKYSTPFAVKALLGIWFAFASIISVAFLVVPHEGTIPVFPFCCFPFFGLIVIFAMRAAARSDEKTLEAFVRSRVNYAECQLQEGDESEAPAVSNGARRRRRNSFIHKYYN